MKTSNKLLIAFAATLILIPVLGMVIVSETQYKTGSYSIVDEIPKVESFSVATKNMTSIALTSAFESVHVPDAKSMVLNLYFIKDDQFGIKIQNEFKDLISAAVDANGQLKLDMKSQENSKENGVRLYANIYIYAPNVSSLTIANAKGLTVKSTADTLNLDLNAIESFYFANDTHIKQLNISAVSVKDLILRRDDIKSINVNLTDTKFAIESMSLNNALITTHGDSKINVYKTSDIKANQTIENLALNTNGIAEVKIDQTTIKNCSGKLSDETLVQMPAVNLNQMYRK